MTGHFPARTRAGGERADDPVAEVLGRADDHGIGVRLPGDPGQLEQRVPADRTKLASFPALGRPAKQTALRRGQYPYPPEELADGCDAGAALPDTVTSCHTPPDWLSPLPLFWPGAVSPT